jgi:hypothetical protein
MRPHRGGTILTLGILGLVVCPFLGVGAWFMGDDDLQQMKQGIMDSSGRDLTNAGRICGIVATCMFIIQVLLLAVFFVGSWLTAH